MLYWVHSWVHRCDQNLVFIVSLWSFAHPWGGKFSILLVNPNWACSEREKLLKATEPVIGIHTLHQAASRYLLRAICWLACLRNQRKQVSNLIGAGHRTSNRSYSNLLWGCGVSQGGQPHRDHSIHTLYQAASCNQDGNLCSLNDFILHATLPLLFTGLPPYWCPLFHLHLWQSRCLSPGGLIECLPIDKEL